MQALSFVLFAVDNQIRTLFLLSFLYPCVYIDCKVNNGCGTVTLTCLWTTVIEFGIMAVAWKCTHC